MCSWTALWRCQWLRQDDVPLDADVFGHEVEVTPTGDLRAVGVAAPPSLSGLPATPATILIVRSDGDMVENGEHV